MISTILLWLFIIDLGIAFGAGLYEHRIVVPNWIRSSDQAEAHWNADAARRDNVGLKFWAFATTGPLTLLTLANLIPTMVRLMGAPDSPTAVATARRWASLNYVRHAIVLAAWLAALEALSLLNQGLG
jgi:hypothetical protein